MASKQGGRSRPHRTATPLLLTTRRAMPEQVLLFFKARQLSCPSVLTSRDWLPTETFGHAYKAPHPSTEQQHAWKLSLARTVLGFAI